MSYNVNLLIIERNNVWTVIRDYIALDGFSNRFDLETL